MKLVLHDPKEGGVALDFDKMGPLLFCEKEIDEDGRAEGGNLTTASDLAGDFQFAGPS